MSLAAMGAPGGFERPQPIPKRSLRVYAHWLPDASRPESARLDTL
jgi:hypothetical protein